jgi:hypothetical protein
MPSSLQWLEPLLLWSALPLVIIGAALIKIGRWPRRRGDAPHCRRCDYELTANLSGRCPECGRELSARRATIRGARRRRTGVALAGVALLALAVLVAYPWASRAVRETDWYQQKPTAWVLHDLDAADTKTRDRAYGEILRRENAVVLSEENRGAFIDHLLGAYARDSQKLPEPMLKALAERINDNQLTNDQRERFFATAFSSKLTVRPQVAAGAKLPWTIRSTGRAPGFYYTYWNGPPAVLGASIDGREVLGPDKRSDGGPFGIGFNRSSPAGASGRHELAVRLGYRVTINRPGSAPVTQPIYEHELTLRAPFEVLPSGASDVVEEVDDASLAPVIQASVKPHGVRAFVWSKDNIVLNCDVESMNLPIDVSFDAFLRYNGKLVPAGSLVHSITEHGRNVPLMNDLIGNGTNPPPDKVDLILRSNSKWARQTVDIHRIWKGELIFENVKVGIQDDRAQPE